MADLRPDAGGPAARHGRARRRSGRTAQARFCHAPVAVFGRSSRAKPARRVRRRRYAGHAGVWIARAGADGVLSADSTDGRDAALCRFARPANAGGRALRLAVRLCSDAWPHACTCACACACACVRVSTYSFCACANYMYTYMHAYLCRCMYREWVCSRHGSNPRRSTWGYFDAGTCLDRVLTWHKWCLWQIGGTVEGRVWSGMALRLLC